MSDGIENPLNTTSEPDQPQEGPLSGGAGELLAAIVSQNVRDAAWTANTLIDSYREDAERNAATIEAIRAHVMDLLDGKYQPSGAAIVRALYPSDATVEAFRQVDR